MIFTAASADARFYRARQLSHNWPTFISLALGRGHAVDVHARNDGNTEFRPFRWKSLERDDRGWEGQNGMSTCLSFLGARRSSSPGFGITRRKLNGWTEWTAWKYFEHRVGLLSSFSISFLVTSINLSEAKFVFARSGFAIYHENI